MQSFNNQSIVSVHRIRALGAKHFAYIFLVILFKIARGMNENREVMFHRMKPQAMQHQKIGCFVNENVKSPFSIRFFVHMHT